jgi:hypothetical protein
MLALGVLRYSQVVSCFLPIVYCNILNSKTNNKKLIKRTAKRNVVCFLGRRAVVV